MLVESILVGMALMGVEISCVKSSLELETISHAQILASNVSRQLGIKIEVGTNFKEVNCH